MKLEVWSAEELESVLNTDAKSYFEKLWHDAGSVREDWSGAGDQAFYWVYENQETTERVLQIVVRKASRVLVFDGKNLDLEAAQTFAVGASTRL
jgi:hypothetical protein